jgi:hypothetical protein
MNAAEIRHDLRHVSRQHGRMDDATDGDLFLDIVDAIVLDVLERIADGAAARHALFRRFVESAWQVVQDACATS